MRYKNWEIEEGDFGYYEAVNRNDCDAVMLYDKTVDGIQLQIDELDS